MFDMEYNLFIEVDQTAAAGVAAILMCICSLSGTMFGAMLDMLTDR